MYWKINEIITSSSTLLLMSLILTCLNVFNGLEKEKYYLIKILMPRVRIELAIFRFLSWRWDWRAAYCAKKHQILKTFLVHLPFFLQESCLQFFSLHLIESSPWFILLNLLHSIKCFLEVDWVFTREIPDSFQSYPLAFRSLIIMHSAEITNNVFQSTTITFHEWQTNYWIDNRR